jgi:hypothetical protein
MNEDAPTNAREFVRLHRSMYLPSDARPLDQVLLLQLVSDILALGIADFAVASFEDWRLVGSDTDWLRLGSAQVGAPLELFNRVVPLIEAGQNSVRHEVVVHAFAEQVVVGEGRNIWPLDSEERLDQGLRDAFETLGKHRVIAFLAR